MYTCVNLCVGVYTYMLVPGEARRVYLGLELQKIFMSCQGSSAKTFLQFSNFFEF